MMDTPHWHERKPEIDSPGTGSIEKKHVSDNIPVRNAILPTIFIVPPWYAPLAIFRDPLCKEATDWLRY